MRPFTFPGSYRDDRGTEPITWLIRPDSRAGIPGFEVVTTVRGVELAGPDLDALTPVGTDATDAPVGLTLDDHQVVTGCVVSGDLPCTLDVDGRPTDVVIRFDLELVPTSVPRASPTDLTLTLVGTGHRVVDDWFEDGLLHLVERLAPDRLRCCLTCQLSDYSPLGHGRTGMLCHRDAKEQYLQVRSKADYMDVPVTEEVPETYLCEEYAPRVPGTGYRG